MAGTGDEHGSDGGLPVHPSLLEPTTGLFSEPFFLATVSWRLVACRRALRPLALALIEVVDGLPGGPVVASDAEPVATTLRSTLRSADVGASMGDGTYGLMLEDTPEDGAVWAVERLRRSLGSTAGSRGVRAGIACYPAQALTAIELLDAARAALEAARAWPQDRIEVAPAAS
ncbi:MAG: hypothetical protein WD691_09180 [Acidimicrobiales bacterium]